MKYKSLLIPARVLDETITSLRAAGQRGAEGVVLWLGRDASESLVVAEAYVPLHRGASNHFDIRPEGMTELFSRLRRTDTMIVAQVHSHPRDAYHSHADDHWAIIRHEGALSFVLPRFAMDTNRANFVGQVAGYCLDKRNRWLEIPHDELGHLLQVQ